MEVQRILALLPNSESRAREHGHVWSHEVAGNPSSGEEPLGVVDVTARCLQNMFPLQATAEVLCLDPAPQTEYLGAC